MNFNPSLRGYALMSIILATLGIFTVSLAFLSSAQHRMHRLQEEATIDTIHQTRVRAIRYFQEYANWPTASFLREHTEVDAYVLEMRVSQVPAFHIRVRLPSAARAEAIQNRIYQSQTHADWLYILMPSEAELGNLSDHSLVLRWGTQGTGASNMETDLLMQAHDIVGLNHAATERLYSSQVNTQEARSGSSSTSQSESEQLKVQYASLNMLENQHAHIQSLMSTSTVGAQLNLEHELHTNYWLHRDLYVGSGAAMMGSSRLVSGTELDVQSLLAESLSADRVLGSSADFNDLVGVSGIFSETNAGVWTTDYLQSHWGYIGQMHAQEARMQDLIVLKDIYTSGGIGEQVGASVQSATALYHQLEHCWFTDKWCRPAEPPILSNIVCYGCEQTSTEGLFQGQLEFQIGTCLHGCSIKMDADWATFKTCSPSDVGQGVDAQIQCAFERYLVAGDSVSDQVIMTVTSAKDASVGNTFAADIRWQTPLYCPQTNYLFPIQGANPAANGSIALPETAAGSPATHTNVGGVGCNGNYKFSHWSCAIEGFCSAEGAWQAVSGECVCYYGD